MPNQIPREIPEEIKDRLAVTAARFCLQHPQMTLDAVTDLMMDTAGIIMDYFITDMNFTVEGEDDVLPR